MQSSADWVRNIYTLFAGLDVSVRWLNEIRENNANFSGMALFAAAPFLGPALGPITGGFLGDSAGWRWIEGFLAIFCGVILILLIVACPETYAPTLLRRRADKLSRATGKVYRMAADKKGKLQLGPLFAAALSRPWKFLIFEPIVSILTLYTAVLYGIL